MEPGGASASPIFAMSAGTTTGGVCYLSQQEAASAWCGAVNVSTPQGLMQCSGTSELPAGQGGPATFVWTARIVAPDGVVSTHTVGGQQLPGCESYDFNYWAPFIGVLVPVLFAIWGARKLNRQVDDYGSA